MKCVIFIGAMVLCTTLDAADSITTRNGKIYTNAVIQRADPDGVVIEYIPQPGSVGIAKLKFANLPDELRKQYNYNPTDAAIFEQNQAAGIARRQEEIVQAELEKRRRDDELARQRAEEALEARRQELAGMNAGQMETGWYDGGYYYDEGDWYGIGNRRFRYNSPGLHPRGGAKFNSQDSSSGVGLTGLGTGWGNSGHWGPIPSQAAGHAARGPRHTGASRQPASGRTMNLSARSR